MKFLQIITTLMEKLMKISQKQTLYMEMFYSFLLNKQIERVNRRDNGK